MRAPAQSEISFRTSFAAGHRASGGYKNSGRRGRFRWAATAVDRRLLRPAYGFVDTNGNWALEDVGVTPDIEVWNDPETVISGGDPQLEAVVREGLRLLEAEKVILREQQPAPLLR